MATATTMTLSAIATEAHKATVRRFVDELWNGANLAVADEIFSQDCVPHSLGYNGAQFGDRYGPKHIKLVVAAWRAAFPDWQITINDLLAEGDKVVLVSTGQGTHCGRLMGIQPTGRRVRFTGMRTFRFESGKIAEYWVLWDWHGLWRQLGRKP
jgi:predicted ester cyclase